ncbi:hypothetical protein DYB30_010124 [Aphanomyces astaci]|uniref:ATP-grasp domain-containing protein n=2 Tax=Aphanomyces astaci TaxID=112090 RepID=A0A397DN57_APHAT|nr:hypothetical protein DYB38_009587 [Aphanomyces astaci]RHY67732.1 hypothetical protein DYB30_010124 [Aphanomyces astaci]RHY83212.1 hypothetical protein DYB31_008264 [Aphanomyces astaci]
MGNVASSTIGAPSSPLAPPVGHPKVHGMVSSSSPTASSSASSPRKQHVNQEQEPPVFRILSSDQRATTFDERIHLRRKSIPLKPHPIPQLVRASTFDPRMRHNAQAVGDVMYKRYFNVEETRDESLMLSAIPELDAPMEAIVVVDPFSTGMVLASEVMSRDYLCIVLYSDTLEVMQPLIKYIPKHMHTQFAAEIYHNGADHSMAALDVTIAHLKQVGVPIVGILPGAETGVMLADRVSDRMGLTTNGADGTEARRNKYAMGEKIRRAGLRAVKQCNATTWKQIAIHFQRISSMLTVPTSSCRRLRLLHQVIVKPVESAGSDDVFLCQSLDQVKKAFGTIQGKINHLGLENRATLVQEYLTGTEYVVDTVSRDGQHKVVAVWEYDKRAVNGAPFVYYGVILREASGPTILAIIAYIYKVLDALHIRHGPGHAEVKFVRGEPCLVEIGSRCHGGEGTYIPIVMPCIGYNQVGATLDAYFDPAAFDRLPPMPSKLHAHGCEAMLVSYATGTVASFPGFPEIEAMPSYVSRSFHTHVGDVMPVTIDMFTTPGSVLLVHQDKTVLDQDYARLRELEHTGLWDLRPLPTASTKPMQVVVVVDPFSTGAVVAERVTSRGFTCICLYSNLLENMESVASLVPDGITLEFAATVEHVGENVQDTVDLLYAAATEVAKGGRVDIVAVIPGAETGVLLADAITEVLQTAGNDVAHTDARRDKYLMGEALRDAGIRAVKQAKCTEWSHVEAFMATLPTDKPLEVVLKPVNSAGTEDVTLCLSMEQAHSTFSTILGKVNGLGLTNTCVLVQEFLDGDEYVIDTVSMEGRHKVTAIWKYDKRRVNDAAFVYFGLSIVPANDDVVNALIDYQFTVLDALGFRNGPGHGEVKFCRGSPVLIEVGARCHGGEGAWVPIADTCVGYNQVDVAVDVYVGRGHVFDALPERPRTLPQYGCEVMLVSYQDGILRGLPGLAEIAQMRSFLRQDMLVKVGDCIRRTIDMFTTPGSILLIHTDPAILDADRRRIRELEHGGLYAMETRS